MPRHTIAPARDRLQSSILVLTAIPVFAFLLYRAAPFATLLPRAYIAKALSISILFALAAWLLRAATPAAALFGGVLCLTLTLFTGSPRPGSPFATALTPLFLLFALTFAATRLGRNKKARSGLAESRRGRNAAQVLANIGIAAVVAIIWFAFSESAGLVSVAFGVNAIPALAALVEATADTVSSEIGQAYGGTPRMILTLRSVPPGTDGAVTFTGTLAGIAAGALVAASAIPALGMTIAQAAIALAAATAGLFFDSLLGATLERRGWIGNDLVNLASTAFAAAVAATIPTRV